MARHRFLMLLLVGLVVCSLFVSGCKKKEAEPSESDVPSLEGAAESAAEAVGEGAEAAGEAAEKAKEAAKEALE